MCPPAKTQPLLQCTCAFKPWGSLRQWAHILTLVYQSKPSLVSFILVTIHEAIWRNLSSVQPLLLKSHWSKRNEDFLLHSEPQKAQLEFSIIAYFNKIASYWYLNKSTRTHTHTKWTFSTLVQPKFILKIVSFWVGFLILTWNSLITQRYSISIISFQILLSILCLLCLFLSGPSQDFPEQTNKLPKIFIHYFSSYKQGLLYNFEIIIPNLIKFSKPYS